MGRRALLCAALASLSLLPPALAQEASATASPFPAPVPVEPDQAWEGADGAWNTFTLRIGEPQQVVRVLLSTASQQTWAVYREACVFNQTDPRNRSRVVEQFNYDCSESRGGTFNFSESATWDRIGYYQLWLKKSLGIGGNGFYGYEKVGIGHLPTDGPTLRNTTVGTIMTPGFWLGHFGINPKPTNFSAFLDPSPSYLTQLFETKQIPSVAWGYTAGAFYQKELTLASLTLGGYDASRFIPNDLTFAFAPDNERDIVVGVVGVSAQTVTRSNIDLMERDSFAMYIDSTIAELYLPIEVCEAMEKAFGLKYDDVHNLYLVDDLLHETLLADNPTITFTLGQKFATNSTIDIALPYSAFDHVAKPPYNNLTRDTRYFPIRRAQNPNQFVFGRTFLQEAYLIVDWERQNFSVSQVDWTFGKAKQIVPILSPEYTGENSESGGRLSTPAIIGIAIGVGFVFTMAVVGVWWWCRRKRKRRHQEEVKAKYASQEEAASKGMVAKCEETPSSPATEEGGTAVFPKAELPAEYYTDVKDTETHGQPGAVVEAGNTERQIFEMPGDMPARQEAGGRQLSEKESMMVRERIYNGVDPNSPPPPVSPVETEQPRRPAPILNPSEVTMVNRRVPNVSPITPRSPRDGASLEANDTFFQPPTRSPRDARNTDLEDTVLSPISPMEETPRRRFSYES